MNTLLRSLAECRDAMIRNDPAVLDAHGQWSSQLPTFGGVSPDDTLGVWSWDAHALLVGTCADDLEIILRPEKAPGVEVSKHLRYPLQAHP